MPTTSDPSDPRLTRGVDAAPTIQAPVYLVLSAEGRARGFIRPIRRSYRHESPCGTLTTMSQDIAETYARDPKFYGSTWCMGCSRHLPVGEFFWVEDGRTTDLVLGS